MKNIRTTLAFAGLFVFVSVRCHALVINETFTNNPALDGWQTFGDTNLFEWNSTNQDLAVTWDSSQSNSYFYHPLGMTLSETNDFMLAFTLRLHDIAIGLEPLYPATFQLAIGLLNYNEATNENFIIGSGYQAPDIVEFDYFPGWDGYSNSVSTPIVSSENNYPETFITVPFTLTTGVVYRVTMIYTADNQTMDTTVTSNGVPLSPLQPAILGPDFDNFAVDTFSINSYSQEGQDTNEYDGAIYAGSILAHGTVTDLTFANPLPVVQIFTATSGTVQFGATTNWVYTLERTTDFQTWRDVSSPTAGVTGMMFLSDTNPPPSMAFYRIEADLP